MVLPFNLVNFRYPIDELPFDINDLTDGLVTVEELIMSQILDANFVTVIRNISHHSQVFGFLPRGRRLAAGEKFTLNGDLITQIADNPRKLAGFQAALDANIVAVEHTPSVFLYDDTLDTTKVLRVLNGTLGVTNAVSGAYSSSIAGVGPYAQD